MRIPGQNKGPQLQCCPLLPPTLGASSSAGHPPCLPLHEPENKPKRHGIVIDFYRIFCIFNIKNPVKKIFWIHEKKAKIILPKRKNLMKKMAHIFFIQRTK